LPDEVGETEPRDQERQGDAKGALHRVREACTRPSAAITSAMSSSECRGPQDLCACALGDGKRRLGGEELAVGGQLVYRKEVDARRDVLLGQEPLVVVTAAACLLLVDPDDVQVVRMCVARVARERLGPPRGGDPPRGTGASGA